MVTHRTNLIEKLNDLSGILNGNSLIDDPEVARGDKVLIGKEAFRRCLMKTENHFILQQPFFW